MYQDKLKKEHDDESVIDSYIYDRLEKSAQSMNIKALIEKIEEAYKQMTDNDVITHLAEQMKLEGK